MEETNLVSRNFKRAAMIGLGLGAGAGAMYFLDPQRGKKRRAIAQAKLQRATRMAQAALEVTSQDLQHRVEGARSKITRVFQSQGEVNPEILESRVRAKMGHIIARPHSIHVATKGHVIRLSGEVHPSDIEPLLNAVRKVPGVLDVEDALVKNENLPTAVTSIKRWSPTQRMWVAGLGSLLVAGGVFGVRTRRLSGAIRFLLGGATLGAGSALILRSASNQPLSLFFGSEKSPSIRIQKMIEISAPREKVFQAVKEILEGRLDSHSFPVRKDTQISHFKEKEELEWMSNASSRFPHCGKVIFRHGATLDQTRVEVDLSYRPRLGWLGHGILKALGRDPYAILNREGMELKASLERESTPSVRPLSA